MGDLRCLTIRQPYASLIAHGIKTWETRSRRTNYRGPVAIHAGKEWEPGWRGVWVDPDRDSPELERYDILIDKLGLEPNEDVNGSGWWSAWDGGRLPLGAVVAVADLTDCLPIVGRTWIADAPYVRNMEDGLMVRWADADDYGIPSDISEQLPYGHWEPGNWAWQLTNVRRLPQPIPARGRLGLWLPHGHPTPSDPDGDLGADIVRALAAAHPETTT